MMYLRLRSWATITTLPFIPIARYMMQYPICIDFKNTMSTGKI